MKVFDNAIHRALVHVLEHDIHLQTLAVQIDAFNQRVIVQESYQAGFVDNLSFVLWSSYLDFLHGKKFPVRTPCHLIDSAKGTIA